MVGVPMPRRNVKGVAQRVFFLSKLFLFFFFTNRLAKLISSPKSCANEKKECGGRSGGFFRFFSTFSSAEFRVDLFHKQDVRKHKEKGEMEEKEEEGGGGTG